MSQIFIDLSKVPEKKPFQSRFLPNHQNKKDETESSSEEESSTEASDDDDDDNQSDKKSTTPNGATNATSNRTSQSRESYDTRRSSRDEAYSPRTRLGGPSHSRDSDDAKSTTTIRSRARLNSDADELSSRAGSNAG